MKFKELFFYKVGSIDEWKRMIFQFMNLLTDFSKYFIISIYKKIKLKLKSKFKKKQTENRIFILKSWYEFK